jgi:hypothetical protein
LRAFAENLSCSFRIINSYKYFFHFISRLVGVYTFPASRQLFTVRNLRMAEEHRSHRMVEEHHNRRMVGPELHHNRRKMELHHNRRKRGLHHNRRMKMKKRHSRQMRMPLRHLPVQPSGKRYV